MAFQLAKVNKALGSVPQIIKTGHRVVFDEGGSYIQQKKSGDRMWLDETDGVFILPLPVGPPKEYERHTHNNNNRKLCFSGAVSLAHKSQLTERQHVVPDFVKPQRLAPS